MIRGAFLAGWMVSVGCDGSLILPSPQSVEPKFGFRGEETAVVIQGQSFYPDVEIDASEQQPANVDPTFHAWLAREGVVAPLRAVVLVDYARIDAVVPVGLAVGSYDLVVESPDGARGTLVDAFSVTATRADHLEIADVDALLHRVYEPASLMVELRGPGDERVFESLNVVVTVEPEVGSAKPVFFQGGLVDGEVVDDGYSFRGALAANGTARVEFAMGVPGLARVSVAPVDADNIIEAVQLLEWTSGEPERLEFVLPSSPMRAIAGEPFPLGLSVQDAFGNPIDEPVSVVLRDSCLSWLSNEIRVNGTIAVEVTLRRATGSTECPENRLLSLIGPTGASEAFAVDPAPAVAFDVAVSPTILVAGERVNAFLFPRDAFGNLAPRADAPLTLQDTVGGVSGATCFGVSPVFCAVTTLVAADAVRLRVSSEDGLEGESAPYDVLPDEPSVVHIGAPPVVVAGEPATFSVTIEDRWGNIVDGASFDVAALRVADGEGELPCTVMTIDADGRVALVCDLYEADPAHQVEVTIEGTGLRGTSGPFEVRNSDLASVTVEMPAGDIGAGEAVGVSLAAFDAWGNPYRVQTDPRVDLSDTQGSWSVSHVDLDTEGQAWISGLVSTAGWTRLEAFRGGVLVGSSRFFLVAPGAVVAVSVATDAPWAFAGEAVGWTFSAVDVFGNRAAFQGQVRVRSASGVGSDVISTVVGGAAQGAFVWPAPMGSDWLTVDVEDSEGVTWSGESSELRVVTRCAGETDPAIRFVDGEARGRACWDEASSVAPLFVQVVDAPPSKERITIAVGDEDWVSDSSTDFSIQLPQVGRWPVHALIDDIRGCSLDAKADAWAGLPNGVPVGWLDITAPASMAIGTSEVVSVSEIKDCAGDPAVLGRVSFRSDRGTLLGTTSTGTGRSAPVSLDSDVAVTLDLAMARSGGPTQVWAWVQGGAAFGIAALSVSGDDLRPVVWEQTPSGMLSDESSAIQLWFSESLSSSVLTTHHFALTGPSSVTSVSLDPGGRWVTLGLTEPIGPSAGFGSLTAFSTSGLAIRDLAGNKLDGAWLGAMSSYVGSWGASAPVIAVDSCFAVPTIFTPDGDPGLGAEADRLALEFSAAAAPASWVFSVYDGAGGLQQRTVRAASGTRDSWRWDGSDASERIVAPGSYRLVVVPDDGFGNRGGACEVWVEVRQHAWD